jgi:hypothetical protein
LWRFLLHMACCGYFGTRLLCGYSFTVLWLVCGYFGPWLVCG